MTKGLARRSRPKLAVAGAKDARASGGPRDYHDRRPLRFWQPFNDWWRSELERAGRRPTAAEIMGWYEANAFSVWKEDAPTLQETRVHAKCLRSLPLVRDYFRNYRAKKRSNGERTRGRTSVEEYDWASDKEDEEDEDDDYPVGAAHMEPGHGDGHGREDDEEDDTDDNPDGAEADGPEGADPYINGYGGGGGHHDLGTAATLNQLVALRSGASPGTAAGLPLDLLPSLPHLMSPATAALLSAGAGPGVGLPPGSVGLAGMGLAGMEPGQPHDLFHSLAVQQLQHAAAVQQQLALAALAQNLALSRATGIGIQALTSQAAVAAAAAAQQNALLTALGSEAGGEEAGLGHHDEPERGRRGGRYGSAAATAGDLDDMADEEGTGAQSLSRGALGRGKRRRIERRVERVPESDPEADPVLASKAAVEEPEEDGSGPNMDGQPGSSGRGVAAAAMTSTGRRGGISGGAASGRRRGSRGGAAPPRHGRRQPAATAPLAEEAGDDPAGDMEGALTLALAPPPLVDVPAILSLEPLPRDVLLDLSREQLMERVLLLQAHLALLMQQQLQHQRIPRSRPRRPPAALVAGPPPPAPSAGAPPRACSAGAAEGAAAGAPTANPAFPPLPAPPAYMCAGPAA